MFLTVVHSPPPAGVRAAVAAGAADSLCHSGRWLHRAGALAGPGPLGTRPSRSPRAAAADFVRTARRGHCPATGRAPALSWRHAPSWRPDRWIGRGLGSVGWGVPAAASARHRWPVDLCSASVSTLAQRPPRPRCPPDLSQSELLLARPHFARWLLPVLRLGWPLTVRAGAGWSRAG